MTGPPSQPTSPVARPVLSRELSEFLIEFSIALNKFAMYPGGHPSLPPAANSLIRRLEPLLTQRGALSVGVARNQLVIEGVATDAKNPVLGDLASRLHRHHLGAISFGRGLLFEEMHELLSLVAVEADRTGEPLGLSVGTRISSWAHIRLYPVDYDRLQLVGAEGEPAPEDAATRSQRTRAAQLWIGMARAALAAQDAGGDERSLTTIAKTGLGGDGDGTGTADAPETTDPEKVARAIDGHQRGTAYDQVIVGYLLQIGEELRAAGGQEALELRKRMAKLVGGLSSDTLQRLLHMGGDGLQRRKFLIDAAKGMSVDAVIDLIRAAGTTNDQTISHSLLRMLQKLARHADTGPPEHRALAEQSVRDQVSQLIQGWSLKDPNPEAYRVALEALSTTDPLFAVAPEAQYLPEPRRIVEMALEVGTHGAPVARAVEDLLQAGQLRWLIDLLASAPVSEVCSAIWSQLATPERLSAVLHAEPLDGAVADALGNRLGDQAAGPMLDALSEVKMASTRRVLLDRLIKLGPAVGLVAMQRLTDPRWYVQRNMLKIIGDLPTPPPGFNAAEFAAHSDARVRREALRILLQNPATRERSILRALGDADERIVLTGLAAARQGCSPATLPTVMSRALSGTTEAVRVAAIRVLGTSASRSVIDVLLRIAMPRRSLLGVVRGPAKSPEYLACLAALRPFRDDVRVRDLLAQAARSKDPEVIEAAAGVLPDAPEPEPEE